MFKSVRNPVILFLFTLLFIQSCKNERVEGPAIRFKSDTFNFGKAKNEEVLSHTFLFFNPGTDTLVLEGVRPSCPSCTNVDEYDKRIVPGERGKIRITYKVAGIPRYADHKVYVKTNVPDKHDITLTITGNIIGKEETAEGFKQKIKNKFSNFSLRKIFSFFGRKSDVEIRLHQLEKMEEEAEKIHESLSCKQGTEYTAMRDKFYELKHERANNAMRFLKEFSLEDLNKNDLMSLLEIAKVAKDERQIFNISRILFDKFPETRNNTDLVQTFFLNSHLLEPGEVVRYINFDMFTPNEQSWMYYMIALGFSEWGDIEEVKNYAEKADNLYNTIILDESEKASIPIPYSALVRAFVLKKIGDNKGADKVIDNARKELSDSNLIKQLEFLARRVDVLSKEALPLETQHWIGTEKPLKLSDLKGKVILVEFFAWNCEQSNIALPYLFKLREEVNNDDFIIIGATHYTGRYEFERDISEEQEYQHMVDHYYKVREINWPISMSKVSFPDYGILRTPDFILIDKKGIVRDGYFIYNYSYLKKKILKLLEES